MKLKNISQPPWNHNLAGCIEGISKYFGYDYSPPEVFYYSGLGFLINMAEHICPSGPYVWKYDKVIELLSGMGLKMQFLGFTGGNVPAERTALEDKVRKNLDAGNPCVIANMDNQIIIGSNFVHFWITVQL